MMSQAQLLETSLLVIWNDRNADRRLEMMKKTYTADVQFYEFNDAKPIVGFAAISDVITKLQAAWPAESVFKLNKPSQVNHSIQIACWDLGPQGAPSIAKGIDVAVIENSLIKSFYLFLEPQDKATE